MTGITIGCDLTITSATAEVMDPAPVPAEIVTVTQPALSPLYAGQALQDSAGFATMTALTNFSSTAGPIVSAIVTCSGAAIDETTALAEGDLAGFSVTVRDSKGNEGIFDAGQITVAYKLNVQTTSGNELQIDVNPLVPDAEVLEVAIGSGVYAGTYNPTAADLRDNTYNLADTITISGTTELGDTLTADDGLWSTPTGELTLTRQWRSDGVNIGGATAATFDITASEQGTDVTVAITGDDGTNAPVTMVSAPVSIPADGRSFSVTQIGSTWEMTSNNNTNTETRRITMTGTVSGREVLLAAALGQAPGAGFTVVVTFDPDGVAAPVAYTSIETAVNAGGVALSGWFDASAAGDYDISITPVSNSWKRGRAELFDVQNRTAYSSIKSEAVGGQTIDLSADAAVGNFFALAHVQNDTNDDGVNVVGFPGHVFVQDISGNRAVGFASYTAVVAETPRAMSVAWLGNNAQSTLMTKVT